MKIIAIAAFFILSSCSNPMSTSRSPIKKFDLQAHRGGRGLMPENTIEAMINGLKLGVNTLEMDAVITKDNQVILSHEPFFNHEISTKPDGSFVQEAEEKNLNIYQMTYLQTTAYDVGLKPHPRFPRQQKMKMSKLLLADVIDSVEAYCKLHQVTPPQYNIETKSNPATDGIYHPAPAEFVDLLMGVVLSMRIEERVIIQSFDARTLRYLHQKYPTIKTALLIEDYDKRPLIVQLTDLGFTPTIYSPAYQLVTPELIKHCHQQNIEIIPWTINEAAEMKRLKDMGVDGLITDYPDIQF